jgi:hypothetical protein
MEYRSERGVYDRSRHDDAMTVHAFVDESARGGGARELHFKKEKEPRRRMLIDRMTAMP